MKLKATDEQIKTMAALACNASRGFGMGMLHYDPKHEAKPSDIEIREDDHDPAGFPLRQNRRVINIDYWNGRMVKFWAQHRSTFAENVWEITPDVPRGDYQSWASKYPTMKSLVEAAGAQVL